MSYQSLQQDVETQMFPHQEYQLPINPLPEEVYKAFKDFDNGEINFIELQIVLKKYYTIQQISDLIDLFEP